MKSKGGWSWSRSGAIHELQSKHRAPRLAADRDAAAMAFDNRLDDGEPQAAPIRPRLRRLNGPGAFNLVEAVEYVRQVFGWNARSGVRDPQHDAIGRWPRVEGDRRARGGVSERVGRQILQPLLETILVAHRSEERRVGKEG